MMTMNCEDFYQTGIDLVNGMEKGMNEEKGTLILGAVLARFCREGTVEQVQKFLEENPERQWIVMTFELALKEDRPEIFRWLMTQGVAAEDFSPFVLKKLIEKKEWALVETVLQNVDLDVNVFDGLLLRWAVVQGDLKGVRLLLENWHADLGLLDWEAAGFAISQLKPDMIDLLISLAAPELKREGLLRLLILEAIRTGKIRVGKYLINTYEVDVNAHGGLYSRSALLQGIFPEEWLKDFFARGLSQEALARLPLETVFSRDQSDGLQVLLANHLDYRMFAWPIENALEIRDWSLLAQEEMVAEQKKWGYPIGEQERDLARKRGDARKQRQFCQFWRVWDRAEFPKDRLAEMWPTVQDAQKKAEMTDQELEEFLRSLMRKFTRTQV